MILNFDRGYGQSAEQMVQSLMESTQMAFDTLERKLGLPGDSLTDDDGNVITDKIEANNVITDKIEANNLSIDGIPIKGCHKIRTSLTGNAGTYTYDSISWYMLASQKVYLEEKLSEQQNGIILVWSAYSSGVPQNWAFNFTVVPKAFISDDPGGGVSTFIIEGAPITYAANKYTYIYDDYIVGHDSNSSTGTSATAIKYTNNRFVLRWVYGF